MVCIAASKCTVKAKVDFLVGLHFNPEGYKILYTELMRLIETELPEHSPAEIPSVLPMWDDAAAWLE